MASVWDTLGITPESTLRDIKRAYASRLKQTRPEDDPEGFQALRDAYEEALAYATHVQRREAQAANEAEAAAPTATEFANEFADGDPTTPPATATPLPPVSAAGHDSGHASGHANTPSASLNNAATAADNKETASAPAVAPIQTEDIPRLIAQLWEKFMMRTDTMSKRQIEIFMHGQAAFQNLSVREAFEFHACCYCAGEDALPQVRNALVEAFNWEQEIRHLQHVDHMIPLQTMGRFNADKVWNAIYHEDGVRNPPLKAMLENRQSPLRDAIMLTNLAHVRQLQKWIYAIRWHYPEILEYKIRPEVLAYWEEKADRKRYFKESVVTSVVFGVPLALVWMLILHFLPPLLGRAAPDVSGWFNLLLGEITSFIGVAVLSFAPRDWRERIGTLFGPLIRARRAIAQVLAPIRDWWHEFYQKYCYSLVAHHRFKKEVHWQAIANFGLASCTLYFQTDNSLWQTVLLAQAVLGLFFIATADLSAVKWVLAPVFGFTAAACALAYTPMQLFIPNCLYFSGFYLLLMRGHLATLRDFGPARLDKLRRQWLALALPFLLGAKFALPAVLAPELLPELMSHPLLLGLMWLFCLSGWQICDYYFSKEGLGQLLLMTFSVPLMLLVFQLDLPPLAIFLHVNLGIIAALTIFNLIFARLIRV